MNTAITEQCDIEMQAARYRLLRRILVAQANGDFELGEKLQSMFAGDDVPKNEAEFDARMDRALALMS